MFIAGAPWQVGRRGTGFPKCRDVAVIQSLIPEWNDIGIQDVYTALVNDEQRTDLIVSDVVSAIEEGRFPLLLTERTDHLQLLLEKLLRHSVQI